MISEKTGSQIQIYSYRWVIIAVFAVINIVVQIQWLSFAPIAKAAQSVYGVSALQIDFFSIIYLAVFVIILHSGFVCHRHLRHSYRHQYRRRAGRDFRLDEGTVCYGLHHGLHCPDRPGPVATVYHQQHHQSGGALVSHHGKGHRRRHWFAGPVSGDDCRHGCHAPSYFSGCPGRLSVFQIC